MASDPDPHLLDNILEEDRDELDAGSVQGEEPRNLYGPLVSNDLEPYDMNTLNGLDQLLKETSAFSGNEQFSPDVSLAGPSAKRSKQSRRSGGKSAPLKVLDDSDEEDQEGHKLPSPSPNPKPSHRLKAHNQAEAAAFLEFFNNSTIPASLVNRGQAADAEARALNEQLSAIGCSEYGKDQKNQDKDAIVSIVNMIIQRKETSNALKKSRLLGEEVAQNRQTIKAKDAELQNLQRALDEQTEINAEARSSILSSRLFK